MTSKLWLLCLHLELNFVSIFCMKLRKNKSPVRQRAGLQTLCLRPLHHSAVAAVAADAAVCGHSGQDVSGWPCVMPCTKLLADIHMCIVVPLQVVEAEEGATFTPHGACGALRDRHTHSGELNCCCHLLKEPLQGPQWLYPQRRPMHPLHSSWLFIPAWMREVYNNLTISNGCNLLSSLRQSN